VRAGAADSQDFEPRGEDSFLGLLRLCPPRWPTTTSAASILKRGVQSGNHDLVEDAAVFPVASSHESARMHRSVLLAQLDEKLRAAPHIISERDRSVFWLYYLQDLRQKRLPGCRRGLTPKEWKARCAGGKWLRAEIGAEVQPSGLRPADRARASVKGM